MKARRLVVCVGNAGYAGSLELRKIYEAVPDAHGEGHQQLRVIDESGEDYLYPASLFVMIDLPKRVKMAIVKAA